MQWFTGKGLTPVLTGPPRNTPRNHTKSASAAPVEHIVRLRFVKYLIRNCSQWIS
jgi:hypothetical protein